MPKKAEIHRPAGHSAYRPENERQRRQRQGARYYDTARWKRLREMVLSRDPLCVECAKHGVVEASTHVDHITPLAQGGTNEMSNLQGLCETCHNKKTATHDGGFGR